MKVVIDIANSRFEIEYTKGRYELSEYNPTIKPLLSTSNQQDIQNFIANRVKTFVSDKIDKALVAQA